MVGGPSHQTPCRFESSSKPQPQIGRQELQALCTLFKGRTELLRQDLKENKPGTRRMKSSTLSVRLGLTVLIVSTVWLASTSTAGSAKTPPHRPGIGLRLVAS